MHSFAPNSTKFDAKTAPLEGVYAYEEYHFVHGEVAYTPLLTNGKKFRTVQGGEITITVLNGSTYLNDVRIIDPDYLTSTGVLHLIERSNFPSTLQPRCFQLRGY
jgi:Fasciclin domain